MLVMKLRVILPFAFAMLTMPACAEDEATKALKDAQAFARAGEFEKALERHEWYHANALSIRQAQYGVRLSFALSYWKQLGDKYPPALASLTNLRDQGSQAALDGKAAPELFHDVVSINRTLKEEAKSVTLFKTLAEKQPDFAKKCFRYMDDTLVDVGELELFEKYSGDLVGYLKRKIDSHERLVGMIRARPGSEQSIKSFEEKLVTLTVTLSDHAMKNGNTDLAAKLKQMTAEVISDPRLAK
jgi:hypothetical protein